MSKLKRRRADPPRPEETCPYEAIRQALNETECTLESRGIEYYEDWFNKFFAAVELNKNSLPFDGYFSPQVLLENFRSIVDGWSRTDKVLLLLDASAREKKRAEDDDDAIRNRWLELKTRLDNRIAAWRQERHREELLKDTGGMKAEGGEKPLASARHSDDFRSVHWFGELHFFTSTQAACVRVLWDAWENGTPDVGDGTIIDQSGSAMNNPKLFTIFRGHRAWGTMIVEGATKGSHRLAETTKS